MNAEVLFNKSKMPRIKADPNRSYTCLINPEILKDSPIGIAEYEYEPDTIGPLHSHDVETEVYYVLEGEGEVLIEGNTYPLSPGNCIYIQPQQLHQTKSAEKSHLKFLGIFVPSIAF